jgi:hypothetical protein
MPLNLNMLMSILCLFAIFKLVPISDGKPLNFWAILELGLAENFQVNLTSF